MVCSVPGCHSKIKRCKQNDISFHEFSRNQAIRRKWICFIENMQSGIIKNKKYIYEYASFYSKSFISNICIRKNDIDIYYYFIIFYYL